MARKKFYTNTIISDPKPFRWKVGLYIRLSREDGDKSVSDSIVNQQKMLKYYIEDSEEFSDYEFFIDENITGTNFNRPAFQEMINKIKTGDINCVVVKDLSRFGRDYLGASHYLEHVFQNYNCRFISIIDDIDSYVNKEMITGLMVRVKNLAHDNNSQNISINVRKTKNIMRAKGMYIALPPYGYNRDPDDKYHLVIDKNVSPIVQNIFKWYIEGYGAIKITKKLNALGVNTKREYRTTREPYVSDNTLSHKKWKPESILNMLVNKAYIGAVAQRKQTTKNYKDRKEIKVPENEQIIVYDMHEPIVTKSDFYLVQEILNNRCYKTSNGKNRVHLFGGYLKCEDCGSPMIRNSTVRRGKEYA